MIQEALGTLRLKGLNVCPHWAQSAVQYLDSELKQPVKNTLECSSALFNLMLRSDLKDLSLGSLNIPNVADPSVIQGLYIVQVEDLVNVAMGIAKRVPNDPADPNADTAQVGGNGIAQRLLKLKLTDGLCIVVAIELSAIRNLHENSPPGTKLLLVDPLVRHGVLLLAEYSCKVLGGCLTGQTPNEGPQNTVSTASAPSAAILGGIRSTTISSDSVTAQRNVNINKMRNAELHVESNSIPATTSAPITAAIRQNIVTIIDSPGISNDTINGDKNVKSNAEELDFYDSEYDHGPEEVLPDEDELEMMDEMERAHDNYSSYSKNGHFNGRNHMENGSERLMTTTPDRFNNFATNGVVAAKNNRLTPLDVTAVDLVMEKELELLIPPPPPLASRILASPPQDRPNILNENRRLPLPISTETRESSSADHGKQSTIHQSNPSAPAPFGRVEKVGYQRLYSISEVLRECTAAAATVVGDDSSSALFDPAQSWEIEVMTRGVSKFKVKSGVFNVTIWAVDYSSKNEGGVEGEDPVEMIISSDLCAEFLGFFPSDYLAMTESCSKAEAKEVKKNICLKFESFNGRFRVVALRSAAYVDASDPRSPPVSYIHNIHDSNGKNKKINKRGAAPGGGDDSPGASRCISGHSTGSSSNPSPLISLCIVKCIKMFDGV